MRAMRSSWCVSALTASRAGLRLRARRAARRLRLRPARVTLRVLGAVPDGGGDAPVLADVLLGVQKNGKIVAKVPSRDTVYLLSDVLAEYIPISLDAYRSRFVTKAPPAEAATAPAEGEAAAPLAAPEAEAPPATP
jgi:hypothetical protein